MSRAADWTSKPSADSETALEILYDDAVSAEVLRSTQTDTDNPGFSEEVSDALWHSINMRIDPMYSGNTNQSTFTALTDDTEVKKDDLIRVTQPNGDIQMFRVVNTLWGRKVIELELEYA